MNQFGAAPPAAAAGTSSRAHGRIGDIEVLRGFAIAMVIIEHLPINLVVWHSHFLAFLQQYCRGWVGVDLFFVISGFVITRGLLPMQAAAPDALHYARGVLTFWIRRAWRLLPSAWLWLAIPLVASLVFRRSGLFYAPGSNFTCLVAGVTNIANLHGAEIFGVENCIAFPYWSLSLEEQFYLVLPLVMFVTGRWLPLAMSAVILFQFSQPHTLLSMFFRPGALATGVLLACFSRTRLWVPCEPTGLSRSATARAAVLVLPIILMGALGADQFHISGVHIGLIALLGGALVWVASYDRDVLVSWRMPRRVLLWLGRRSYSIYLIHIPAFAATREIWLLVSPAGTSFDGRFALRFLLTAAVLICAFAEANHRFVEQPLRRRGNRIAADFAQRPLPS